MFNDSRLYRALTRIFTILFSPFHTVLLVLSISIAPSIAQAQSPQATSVSGQLLAKISEWESAQTDIEAAITNRDSAHQTLTEADSALAIAKAAAAAIQNEIEDLVNDLLVAVGIREQAPLLTAEVDAEYDPPEDQAPPPAEVEAETTVEEVAEQPSTEDSEGEQSEETTDETAADDESPPPPAEVIADTAEDEGAESE